MALKPSKEDYQKLEVASTKSTDRALRWSHNLAAGRAEDEFNDGYFRTPEYQRLSNHLSSGTGQLIILTGTQGVGKTATLRHLYHDLNPRVHKIIMYDLHTLLVLWGDEHEQIRNILKKENEFFAYHAGHPYDCYLELKKDYCDWLKIRLRNRFFPIKLPEGKEIPTNSIDLDVSWAEKLVGKATYESLRERVWFEHISRRKLILIDLPDYGRTDRRLLTRHLNEIYRLWIRLSHLEKPPSLVIAMQKEFLQGHFFFDKMDKIELLPLSTDQLVASYEALFGSTDPFTQPALLTLASKSRGNYRRFKRYVAIAIESWPQSASLNPITDEHVRQVISTERVEEDLDRELEQIFPKNPDARQDAVRIILHLSDSGSSEQGELAKTLEIPEYTLSRLLSKLQLHRYIARKARGLQKIVSLVEV